VSLTVGPDADFSRPLLIGCLLLVASAALLSCPLPSAYAKSEERTPRHRSWRECGRVTDLEEAPASLLAERRCARVARASFLCMAMPSSTVVGDPWRRPARRGRHRAEEGDRQAHDMEV